MPGWFSSGAGWWREQLRPGNRDGVEVQGRGLGRGRRAAGWAGALRGMEAFLVAVVDGKRDAARSRGGVARWARERLALCWP